MTLPESSNLRGDDERSRHGGPVILKWHQFHLWISSKDFAFLEQLSQEQEESIAQILRRLIRQYRSQLEQRNR